MRSSRVTAECMTGIVRQSNWSVSHRRALPLPAKPAGEMYRKSAFCKRQLAAT